MEKPKHGGMRKGAGRRKEEDTKRVRVPVGCLNEVQTVIAEYKSKKVTTNTQTRKKGQESKSEKPMIQTKNGYVEARYWWTDKDGANLFWSGRGKQPKWFKDYINGGGDRKDLGITSWKAGGKWELPQ